MSKHTDIPGKGRIVKRIFKKNCKRCDIELTLDNKWKDEALCVICGPIISKEREKKHLPKRRLAEQIWRKNNPEKVAQYKQNEKNKKSHYKRKYNLNANQVNELLNRGCEACGSMDNLRIDHCHNTQKVRGCLCHGCNCAIGFIKDNPDTLRKLAHYLEAGLPKGTKRK
jgi:hypothetical protein